MARCKKTRTLTAKLKYQGDYCGRFRHLLKAYAYDNYGDDVDSHSAANARECLAALDKNDAIKAAYAAFGFGLAMTWEKGPEKTLKRMLDAKLNQKLIYSDDFRRKATAIAAKLRKNDPGIKKQTIAKRVNQKLGGPCYKVLMGWLKKS